jgi:hypothetical protein
MKDEDFFKVVSVKITLGHLLLVWDIMSNKFSDLKSNEYLSEDDKKAIWGLTDLLENSLIANDITNMPQAEWESLVAKAKEFIRTISVDFLD